MQVVDEIPVRLRFSDVESEFAKYPKEQAAVDIAKAKGWRHALETQWDGPMVSYSGDRKRWKTFEPVPLTGNATVLEVGIGFGQHTGEIASRVAHLDALEVKLVNAMFAKTRCEQENIRNVTFTCGGDDCLLPFEDNRYDVVLFNLVFEWCGSESRDEPHEVAQRRLLTEAYRVLKPGGLLQLNTKNRFSYRLLTGGPDEHIYEMPFGSALPRWLCRLMLRLQGKPRPPGYLYSWWGLRGLLRDAGFDRMTSYWTAPEMRYPEHVVAADAQSIRAMRKKTVRQGAARRTNLMMRLTPAWMVKFVAPGLYFIARKS
jgi:SAM-dependent methyltransferase